MQDKGIGVALRIALIVLLLELAPVLRAQPQATVPESSGLVSAAGPTHAPSRALEKESKRTGESLTDLSLEELMSIDVNVLSASKKTETLSQAAAAIFVLRSEDIRRSGAATITDALRMVPGLYVAQPNQRNEMVSARGFSDFLNSKMLVLVDGRNIYTPEFGGVYWVLQNLILEDIDCIEVIRGPGGTLWGANAVNGVINIITKDTQETQGVLLSTSIGSQKFVAARYGGSLLGGYLTFRIFGRGDTWEPGVLPSGEDAFYSGNQARLGIRADWKTSARDALMLQAEGYRGTQENLIEGFMSPSGGLRMIRDVLGPRGGHLLLRWRRQMTSSSSTEALGYCDWNDWTGLATESRMTCDAEFQHTWQIRPRHSLIWGANLERSRGLTDQSFGSHGVPRAETTVTVSGVGQYEFVLVPDHLRFIVGNKIEHNSYTGLEVQPQFRSVLSPVKAHTVWGAVSRAVRTPTRVQHNMDVVIAQLPTPIPTFLTVVGNQKLRSEVLRAYELGYRFEPSHKLSFDAAIFYNDYEWLSNGNLLDPLGTAGAPVLNANPTYLEFRLPWQNLGSGQTHGAEIYVKWRPLDRWSVGTGVTELRGGATNFNSSINMPMNNTPRHQFNIQSRFNLTSRLELDGGIYHYNGIPSYSFGGVPYQGIPTHNRVDLGLSWRKTHGFTFAVWAHDVGAGPHWENRSSMFMASGSEVRGRSVAIKALWEFGRE